MKNLILFSFLCLTTLFVACDDDDNNEEQTNFEYHAHIMAPNTDNKHMGHTLPIEVEFESHTGQTVHHINVRIYKKSDNTEIYNKPDVAHVHETSGSYTFMDSLELTAENGFEEHTDYVLVAKVWGHDAGHGEETEEVEFHVHP